MFKHEGVDIIIPVYNALDDLSTIKCMASSAAIIVDSFNIEVNGYKIQVADSVFGYVSNKEERDEILQKVCLSYINELGIEPFNTVCKPKAV